MEDDKVEEAGKQELPDGMLLAAVDKALETKPIPYRLLSRLMVNGTVEQQLSLIHLIFLQATHLRHIQIGLRLWDEFLPLPDAVSRSRQEGLSDAYFVALIRLDLKAELPEAARRRRNLGLKPFEHIK